MSEKDKVKEEPKAKKSTKKKKQVIQLSYLSDEEEKDESREPEPAKTSSIFGRKREDLKNRLEKREEIVDRALAARRTADDGQDVFTDSKASSPPKVGKMSNKDKELEEVKELLEELQSQRQQESGSDANDSHNESIELLDLIDNTPNQRGSRGRGRGRARGRGRGRGRGRAKTPNSSGKKTRGRGRGRGQRNSCEFNENNFEEAFDRMDRYEDKNEEDDIQVMDNSMNNSQQDLDDHLNKRDVHVMIKYRLDVHKYTLKPNEKFAKILHSISETLKENIADLVLSLNDRIIDTDSTPQSIGLEISDIIDCHKRSANKSAANGVKDPNDLSLKLRDKTMKSHETLTINKFATIAKVMEWFAQYKGIAANKIRLEFDGDRLDPKELITDCDIEDESQIDVILL